MFSERSSQPLVGGLQVCLASSDLGALDRRFGRFGARISRRLRLRVGEVDSADLVGKPVFHRN